MTLIFGNFGLGLGVFVAAGALMAALTAARFESALFLRAARSLVAVFFGLMCVSSVALLIALVTSDFRYEYVASYTERALPMGYKLAAFWAGQAGSLLFWGLVLSGMSLLYVLARRNDEGVEPAVAVAALSGVLLFFAALMLFAANPFATLPQVPADGHGLNPMLQDPAMIAHPPILFLGYAGYTIPFAALLAALVAGRSDNAWLGTIRRWSIASWLFLSIGILLGAQWAYVELGWGGYWAWDPVENASLLPWLTGTALLHSVIVQQHRGMMKLWNAVLIAASFVLCIFGTYLTRSGVIQSVHSFGESPIGSFFLTFLVTTTLLTAGVIAWRRRLLKPEHPLEVLTGREGMFMATNVLLVLMTLVTLVGTIFPILSRTFGGQEVTVGQNFYNKVVAPMGLLLAAMMAVGPLLTYGKDAPRRLVKGLVLPVILAVAVVALLWVRGLHNPWALICAAIAAVAVVAIVVDFVGSVFYRVRGTGENPFAAVVGLLDANHRRYGGQVVHVGVMMIVIGVTASSLFVEKRAFPMNPGQTVQFAGRSVTFNGLKEVRFANFTAVEADVTVKVDATGETHPIHPQRRFYDKSEQANSEVAIESNWREDLYITLAGWEAGGHVTTLEMVINPLVSWIWVGGIVLTAGGVICMLPRLIPARLRARKPAEVQVGDSVDEEPAPVPTAAARLAADRRNRKVAKSRNGVGASA